MTPTAARNESATKQPGRDPMGSKYKVLFIGPGPVPPSKDPQKNLHFQISDFCEGDYITEHWGSRRDYRGRSLTDLYDTLGSFRYHATLSGGIPRPLRLGWEFAYLLRKGVQLSRSRGPFDAIVAYGPFSFAVVGWLLRRWTSAKLVVEVPGPPTGGHAFERGLVNRVKSRLAQLYVPRLLRSADALRLYFPNQLDELPAGNYPPAFVFPDLVAVSTITSLPRRETSQDGRYALFMGHPFERKGVDVLIKAFRQISDRHTDLSLKIVGYCPDVSPYQDLVGDNPRISFLPGQSHEKAMELMAGCTFFVLPSRAEGVPRVLIEAMAAKKPVISTRVDGIPYLVEDGVHGLLVEPDDVEGLASKMDLLQNDPELARRVAEAGYDRVLGHFSEECYKQEFRKMMVYLAGERAPRRSNTDECL
ncbi:MAG: glycosyltransferase family 4 protein [Isosphaerales bacterium]